MSKRRVVSVTWVDASSHDAWESSDEDCGVAECTTIGFLLHDKPSHVTVTHTIGVQGTGKHMAEDTCCVISIPRGCITSIKNLKAAPK